MPSINTSPDVVISFMDKVNVITLISTIGLQIPIFISERIDPRQHPIGRVWAVLRDYFYDYAKCLIVQSHAVEQWAHNKWWNLSIQVIPNPVVVPNKEEISLLLDKRFHWFIAMGRLTQQKGFDILINAFLQTKANESENKWRLIILGEGDQRLQLEQQIARLGLANQVIMPGRVKNPYDYLYQADIFILSFRFEGFPNALLEAMACGLPVIATDCPSGPAAIVTHEVNGLLVEPENSQALAKAMKDLMTDEMKRNKLANAGLESILRFCPENIMSQWEAIIKAKISKD